MDSRRPARSPSPARGPGHGEAGSRLELTIDSLAFGGEGVARHGGLVVLVCGGLPGDRVRARILHRSSNFARAQAEEVLSPSPDRVAARCPHFPECGGCAYQNLHYPVQLAEKRKQVRDLLERMGRFPDPPVADTLASPEPFLYRSRMTYALAAGKASGPGLHRRGAPGEILEVEGCLLPESPIQEAYLGIRTDLRRLDSRQRPAQVEIQGGEPGERPVALLRGRGGPGGEVLGLAARWTGGEGPFSGVVWSEEGKGGRRFPGGRTRTLAGKDHVFRHLGRYRYRVPAGSFFQANATMAGSLFEEVARRSEVVREGILELHSGVGALSLFLGASGNSVLALEADRAAVGAALENSRENRIPNVEFRVGEVGKELGRLEASARRFGAVVVDPPRSGLPRGAARVITRLAREKILYLSCNPPTLARDLREIAEEGAWRLSEVVPADMFPHTAEIECLAELVPESGGQAARSRTSPSRRDS